MDRHTARHSNRSWYGSRSHHATFREDTAGAPGRNTSNCARQRLRKTGARFAVVPAWFVTMGPNHTGSAAHPCHDEGLSASVIALWCGNTPFLLPHRRPRLDSIAYVNGSFVPLSEAKVSILDRGFLFADGIYEVAAVLDGKLVDNASHLARLKRSVGEIALELPESLERIEEIQKELVARNKLESGLVYLEVTRGADTSRDFAFPKGVKPTLVMFTSVKDIVNSPSAKSGIAVITVPDIRWERRDIKSVALLAQVLAKQAAAAVGAGEAWMIEDGKVTEGGSSSAFIVTQDDVLVTRQNGSEILPGCTRKAVVQLAEERQLRVEERAFTIAEALAAKEAFITSASSFVQPVVSIDGKPIANGKPGPMATRLREIYIDFARATAV